MRRLVLSFPVEELNRIQKQPVSQNIKILEVLHVLRQERNAIAVICRITLKDPAQDTNLFNGVDQAQLLDRTRDGVCTYFLRTKVHRGSTDYMILQGVKGYLMQPFGIREDRVTLTFMGDSKQVKRFLQTMEKLKIHHKVLSLTDARFPVDSPLGRLTEKQRRVLVTAYRLGYYDLPKKVTTRELAKKLGVDSSTIVIHRIKAERRLIAEVMGE